jgi:hypothetical protein
MRRMEAYFSTLRGYIEPGSDNSGNVMPVPWVLLQDMYDTWTEFVQAWTETRRQAPVTEKERRFWNRVEVRPGGHYIWTGMGRDRPDGVPVCDWTTNGRTTRTTAARVAWVIERGCDIPPGRNLKRTCTVSRCIAPNHHELSSDYSGNGRPSNLRFDGEGRPVCKFGHPLKRVPKPRETVHCPTCYQEDQRVLRTYRAAQESQYIRAKYTTPVPPSLVDPDSLSVDGPSEPKRDYAAEIMAMFETGEPAS